MQTQKKTSIFQQLPTQKKNLKKTGVELIKNLSHLQDKFKISSVSPIISNISSTRFLSTNAVSPRFRASDTHDLRRGLRTQTDNRSFA